LDPEFCHHWIFGGKVKTSEIVSKSVLIRDFLKTFEDFGINPIDASLLSIPPYRPSNAVKLIIIGQDPTIKNENQRSEIEFTLNLDKDGPLKRYIQRICTALGVDFENIYATNVFKYFYSKPPATTMDVLKKHLPANLALLKEEFAAFDNVPIVTLGEPVLRLLQNDNCPLDVKHFWGYDKKSQETNGRFSFSKEADNKLGLPFFPLPHQPSISKAFYAKTFDSYLDFMKQELLNTGQQRERSQSR
jgi:uracil-DNA glycosylase